MDCHRPWPAESLVIGRVSATTVSVKADWYKTGLLVENSILVFCKPVQWLWVWYNAAFLRTKTDEMCKSFTWRAVLLWPDVNNDYVTVVFDVTFLVSVIFLYATTSLRTVFCYVSAWAWKEIPFLTWHRKNCLKELPDDYAKWLLTSYYLLSFL